MKKSAFLINNSRGGIVDEQALANALNEGLLAGAAADVFTEEPVPEDHPLRHARGFLGTPHSAALARESKARMMRMTAESCITICKGGETPNVVDRSVYQHRRPV